MSQVQALVEISNHRPILVEAKDDGKIYVEGIASEAGVKNLNGRVYPVAVMERAVADAQPRIAEGAFTGELDHPEVGYRGKLSRTAIRFTNLYMEGNTVKFKGVVLETEDGKKLQALIAGGVKIGMSTRGSGTFRIDESTKQKVINDDYFMHGIDAVDVPSSETGIMRLQESLENSFNEHKGFTSMPEIKSLQQLKESEYGPLVNEATQAAEAEKNTAIQEGQTYKQEVETLRARVTELEGQLTESASALTGNANILAKFDALSERFDQLNAKLAESQAELEKEKTRNANLKLINEAFETEVKDQPFETIIRKHVLPESFETVEAVVARVSELRSLLSEVPAVPTPVKEGKETGKGIVESGNDEDAGEQLTEAQLIERRLLGNPKKGK